MKIKMITVVAFVLMCTGASLLAASSSVTLDLPSGYVWRGVTFNDGTVLQPSFDAATDSGLGFNVWGNIDLDDYDGLYEKGELSEIDLTVYYTLPLGDAVVGIEVGFVEYSYIDHGDTDRAVGGTREVYASIRPKDCPLGSSLTIFYDIDEVDDFYVKLAIGKELALGEKIGAKLAACIGYMGEDMAAHYAGGTDGGLADYQVSVTASYRASEALIMSLMLAYVDSLDEDVIPEQDVDLYGKASVGFAF